MRRAILHSDEVGWLETTMVRETVCRTTLCRVRSIAELLSV